MFQQVMICNVRRKMKKKNWQKKIMKQIWIIRNIITYKAACVQLNIHENTQDLITAKKASA